MRWLRRRRSPWDSSQYPGGVIPASVWDPHGLNDWTKNVVFVQREVAIAIRDHLAGGMWPAATGVESRFAPWVEALNRAINPPDLAAEFAATMKDWVPPSKRNPEWFDESME